MHFSQTGSSSVSGPRPDGAARPALSLVESKFILALLLSVVTLLVYLPARTCSFINYDDNYYVTQNTHVWSGLSWKSVLWAFTTFDVANWHPLTWISHMIDYEFYSLRPAGHHLTSVFLHIANAVLLFWILQAGTRRVWRSLLVAALFALHPMNVESVLWVAERKNVLSTLFFLQAIAAYGWYVRKMGWKRYLVVALLFALGLMAKPMVVTLPCVLLLLDLWPLGRLATADVVSHDRSGPFNWRRAGVLIAEKLPLFLLSAASAVVTLLAQGHEGAVNPASFPVRLRVGNALLSYTRYLGKIFFPVNLSIAYPHPRGSLQAWQVMAAAAVLVAVTLILTRIQRRPYGTAGWLWFLGTLVPVIGLIQVGSQAMADRYAYIPMIGILVAVVWLAADWMERWSVPNSLRLTVCAVVLIVLSLLTLKQESYWKNDITLFSHALAVTRDNNVAHDLLGLALAQSGRLDEAAPHFSAALAINPRDEMAISNFGYYLLAQGDVPGAENEFKLAIATTHNRHLAARMYTDLGALAWKSGRLDEAEGYYLQSLRLVPDQYRACLNLGIMSYDQGKVQRAVQYISQSLELFPTAAGYLSLGRALHAQHRDSEALDAYRRALQLSPDIPGAKREMDELQGTHP